MTITEGKKVPSWALVNELKWPLEEIIKLGEKLCDETDRTRVHARLTWYSPAAADKIRRAIREVPLTEARHLDAYGLHEARNPRWLFCKVEGNDTKQPVLIPRKLQGRLVHKSFKVEAIEDVNGITYRHVLLSTGARV